jgi:hypothetical protein
MSARSRRKEGRAGGAAPSPEGAPAERPGWWRRRAARVFRDVERYAAVVFEVYFDKEMRPHVELKRRFARVEEAEEYVRRCGYLDEEGEELDPREFLIYLKYAGDARIDGYASTTVVTLLYR